jgi:ribosome-binding protein aMBF1 (putative translation factor)
MNNKKYDIKKIKKLTSFDEVFKKDLKTAKGRKNFDFALKRLDLSHKIATSRLKAKMTQAEFAKELKTSQSFVARMENGDQNLTIDVLFRVADVLSRKLNKQVRFSIVGDN